MNLLAIVATTAIYYNVYRLQGEPWDQLITRKKP